MSIKTDHETALEQLRLNAELTARDDALLRFVDSEKQLRAELAATRALLLKLRPLTLQVCRSRGGNSLEATHLTHEIDAVKETKEDKS
jgi:hypothetical protein